MNQATSSREANRTAAFMKKHHTEIKDGRSDVGKQLQIYIISAFPNCTCLPVRPQYITRYSSSAINQLNDAGAAQSLEMSLARALHALRDLYSQLTCLSVCRQL